VEAIRSYIQEGVDVVQDVEAAHDWVSNGKIGLTAGALTPLSDHQEG
jgi:hypothetical protein